MTKLKAISALVALVGSSASNILEFVEENEGDSFGAIARLTPPKLLVMYTGTAPSGSPMRYWRHDFSIIVRVNGSPAAVFKQFVEGVPTGETLPMMNATISTGVHPMAIPSLQRRVIPVSEQSSFDYWEIQTSFTE